MNEQQTQIKKGLSKKIIVPSIAFLLGLAFITGAILSYTTIFNAQGTEPITVLTPEVAITDWLPAENYEIPIDIQNSNFFREYAVKLVVTETSNEDGVEYTILLPENYTILSGSNTYYFNYTTPSNTTIGDVNFSVGYERL